MLRVWKFRDHKVFTTYLLYTKVFEWEATRVELNQIRGMIYLMISYDPKPRQTNMSNGYGWYLVLFDEFICYVFFRVIGVTIMLV